MSSTSDGLYQGIASLATGLIRLLPAEMAHDLGMWLMQQKWFCDLPQPQLPPYDLKIQIPQIGKIAHPICLAAGFDKDAKAPLSFQHLGLSMLELGTITPLAQSGNPKPRMFRYNDQRAIINRMGFNSTGSQAVKERLEHLNVDRKLIPFGINVGKNKLTPADKAIEDYIHGVDTFHSHADYLVVNISSPNTEGLRNLADVSFIKELSEKLSPHKAKIWIKLDPDMLKPSFQKLVEAIANENFAGVVLTNTHKVNWPQSGGQSGHPLTTASNARLEWAWQVHQGSLPMIASGGILSGRDVFERIARGAYACQIYSALVFRGPWAVAFMLSELIAEMELSGLRDLEELRGSFYK